MNNACMDDPLATLCAAIVVSPALLVAAHQSAPAVRPNLAQRTAIKNRFREYLRARNYFVDNLYEPLPNDAAQREFGDFCATLGVDEVSLAMACAHDVYPLVNYQFKEFRDRIYGREAVTWMEMAAAKHVRALSTPVYVNMIVDVVRALRASETLDAHFVSDAHPLIVALEAATSAESIATMYATLAARLADAAVQRLVTGVLVALAQRVCLHEEPMLVTPGLFPLNRYTVRLLNNKRFERLAAAANAFLAAAPMPSEENEAN